MEMTHPDVPDHSDGIVSVRVESGNTPFVDVSVHYLGKVLANTVIFDTQNRKFYEFPELIGIFKLVRWCPTFQWKVVLYSWKAISDYLTVTKELYSPSRTSLCFAPILLSSKSS